MERQMKTCPWMTEQLKRLIRCAHGRGFWNTAGAARCSAGRNWAAAAAALGLPVCTLDGMHQCHKQTLADILIWRITQTSEPSLLSPRLAFQQCHPPPLAPKVTRPVEREKNKWIGGPVRISICGRKQNIRIQFATSGNVSGKVETVKSHRRDLNELFLNCSSWFNVNALVMSN